MHTDPLTGAETSVDPAELADLSPAEAKAYVAYFAVHGTPPPEGTDRIESHPYLDPFGQWRMSDTNEPVWPNESSEPLSPGQYIDLQGQRRWSDTNQLVEQFPNRGQYQDDDGVWRWADTGAAVDENPDDNRRGAEDWSPATAATKVPDDWGSGQPNKKGVGRRWTDPDNPGNGIRIDKGDPNNSQEIQRTDHVVVRHNGVVIGRDGKPLPGRIAEYPELAHIPLEEWLTWSEWNRP